MVFWILTNKSSDFAYRRTIAMLQMKHGLTKEKILEYLQVFEDLGIIELVVSKDSIKKKV